MRRDVRRNSLPCYCFNPRTPGGVRPKYFCKTNFDMKFQSTHPGRGATGAVTDTSGLSDVSIHAPRAGCDVKSDYDSVLHQMFQSTHPGRGATCTLSHGIGHATVSIHAPRAGCDAVQKDLLPLDWFQSTHPGRGATEKPRCVEWAGVFQSTHPGRGATVYHIFCIHNPMFQSTHPGRGATCCT